MSSLLTTLSLSSLYPTDSLPTNLAAPFLIFHFIFAYAAPSSRAIKMSYRFDHNACPREDVSKYGEKMVKEGKLERRTLERMKRLEAAHANAVEGFTLFIGGILMALHANVPTENLNGLMAIYTLSRIGHAAAYIMIESEEKNFIWSVLWLSGNLSCLSMIWNAGSRLSSVA